MRKTVSVAARYSVRQLSLCSGGRLPELTTEMAAKTAAGT